MNYQYIMIIIFSVGITKDTIPDTTIHAKNNISFKVTVEKEKEQPTEQIAEATPAPRNKNLMRQPSLGLNKIEHYADDTFENILLVTAQHEALMTFYYLDDSNKVSFPLTIKFHRFCCYSIIVIVMSLIEQFRYILTIRFFDNNL